MKFGKTLIIQPSPGIGDTLWHLPYFRALATHSAHGKISLLTKSRSMTKEWLAADPMIDTIYYFERRGLTRSIPLIRREKFQTVWVLHRSVSYALMAALAGVKNRYGFGYGKQKWALNQRPYLEAEYKSRPTIDQVRRLLDEHHITYDPHDYGPILPKDVKDQVHQAYPFLKSGGGSVALGIGASEGYKQWPLDSFAKLALELHKRGVAHLLLCGGPQDAENAASILTTIQKAGGNALQVTDKPIAVSLALMGACDFYIGNDSGLMNAAACQGIPTIGLFGGTPPLTYSPHIHPLEGKGMTAITPEMVLEKYVSLQSSILLGVQIPDSIPRVEQPERIEIREDCENLQASKTRGLKHEEYNLKTPSGKPHAPS